MKLQEHLCSFFCAMLFATYNFRAMHDLASLVGFLSRFATPSRVQQFNNVLAYRTRYITIVLEDIYQSQNASAVLRTCECYGIQDIHVLQKSNTYTLNPDVTKGSDKWLNISKYRVSDKTLSNCMLELKKSGYRLVATSPSEDATDINNFDIEQQKTAFMFGNEHRGLSNELLQLADVKVKIPIYGFTESYNISVSVAIILNHCVNILHRSNVSWKITQEEQLKLMLDWLKKSVKRPELLINRFYTEVSNKTP
ncbi:MAG: RNA methyltransferase [Bacteroidales bacterium]|nr:RNA methyltransferase [Bacteroidales bacterium]